MKKLLVLPMLVLALTVTLCAPISVYAEETEPQHAVVENDNTSPILITKLTDTLLSNCNNMVYRVKNTFTFISSTVEIYIDLYSSLTYETDYTKMKCESSNHIDDLNMGEALEVFSPINGVQRYWMGRLRYRCNNSGWKEKFTSTHLIDINGNKVN